MGRQDDALAATEEAVALRRQLAAARPEAFRPDLALSLNNLSVRLARRGAAGRRRWPRPRRPVVPAPAAGRRPAGGVHSRRLALSLNNLSVRLADVGRQDDALAAIEEAVALRRQLAAARPEAFTARPRPVAEQPVEPAERRGAAGRRAGRD